MPDPCDDFVAPIIIGCDRVVKDEGCQTNASACALFVDSEGVIIKDGRTSELTSFDIADLASRSGFNRDEVCGFEQDNASDVAKAWKATIDAERERRDREYLSPDERRFAAKVWAFQKLVDFSRFRVYGRIDNDGRWCIVLVTEFTAFSDDLVWDEIDKLREATRACLWIMYELPRIDKYYPALGVADERLTDEPLKLGSAAAWVVGKNHDRLERQVEFSWRVELLDVTDVEQLLRFLSAQTGVMFERCGVGVC